MRTENLSKLLIFGSNKDKKEIISRLQDIGVMHISKAKKEDYQEKLSIDDPAKDVDVISHLLLKLKYIKKQTNLDFPFTLEGMPPREKAIHLATEFLDKNLHKIENLSKRKSELNNNLAKLTAQRKSVEDLPFELKSFNTKTHNQVIIKSKEDLNHYPFSVKVKVRQSAKVGKSYFSEIQILKKYNQRFQNSLRKSNIRELNLPKMPEGSKEFWGELSKKEEGLKEEIEKVETHLYQKINGKQSQIQFLITCLTNYRKQANISSHFLRTKNFFAIQGYVIKEDVQRILNYFPETLIYEEDATTGAPSKLKNKGFAKNFESITTMFGIPTYSLVDPTPLVSIFFPFFFGFMLSDIGYGLLLLLAIGAVYFHLGDKFKKIAIILGSSAISSIIFGLVFGSFFGNLIKITPLYQDSFTASFMILKISLIIGLVHINIGVLLKIYQEYLKRTSIYSALSAILPIPLIQATVAFIYFNQKVPAAICAVILLFILLKEKGLFGLMDITGFFGMWFSYARLLALSLATAGVALAVNIIAQKALTFGKIGVLLFFIVLGIGHLFNFVLNILGCAIHSARLHYVEFFSLFFEGEGYEFREFKIRRNLEEK